MVALRGKKAKVQTKPKAVEKAAATAAAKTAKVAAAKDMDTAPALLLQQQKLARSREEDFLRFVRFVVQTSLLYPVTSLPGGHTVTHALNTLLTALCATGKDRSLAPAHILAKLTRLARKRVCGAIFSADEIAYSCRNCQLDATCVTCKDCFTHSDHTGHDVYFQRTTAGSSCDCGDLHAWKASGFCSRHKGAEDSETSRSKRHKLPMHIAVVAPVVIDAVVEHVYQVMLGAEYGFELADALELFTRSIPPQFLPIQTDVELSGSSAEASNDASTSRTTFQTSGGRTTRGSGISRLAAASSAPRDDGALASATGRRQNAQQTREELREAKSEEADSTGVLFGVRLHNDDVHSMLDVVNHLCVELDLSKSAARSEVNKVDEEGDAMVGKRTLLQCPAVVGNLSRRSLNISVAPTWWEKQKNGLPVLLEWLYSVSTTSDGLGELVSESLRKQRAPAFKGFDPLSPDLVKGKTIRDFVKYHQVRLHSKTTELLVELVGEDTDVFTWACKQEEAQRRRFGFRLDTINQAISATTAVTTAGGHQAGCNNVFIEEFIKAVSLSHSYRRHESVREGFDAVVNKYFTAGSTGSAAAQEATETKSALTLLVRYDCTLQKDTAEESHALLREHLLDMQFRASMLEAYVSSYMAMTSMFLRGLGNSSESIFDFAVQFLTVPHLVQNYTKKELQSHPERPHLVRVLVSALKLVFQSALLPNKDGVPKSGVLNPDHPALSSQKYKHCVENLEYVLNIGNFSNELVCNEENLKIWLSCLQTLQGGNAQMRRGIHQYHVEYESDSWLSMFNLGIRVHSAFAITWNGFSPSQLELAQMKVSDIFDPIISTTISTSAQLSNEFPKKVLAPLTKLVTASKGPLRPTDVLIPTYDFDVAAHPTTLHIPLHRFLVAAVRHICIYQSGFGDSIPSNGFLSVFGFDKLELEEQFELVEMPLRCLVMTSQIHSNLWRRNGDENMLAQLYNYSALPYCIHYRDADTFLMQLGVLMIGPDAVLARMVDRFQLAGYLVLPTADAVESAKRHGDHASEELARLYGYTPLEEGIDAQQRLQMLEEFLRLVIVLGTSLPSSTGATYENEFLLEEMQQQLCSKSHPFSKLFDLAILPSGQDDIATARLEGVLEEVSNFVPPSGLEPGRYELKDGLLDHYNPYFLHLNREAHELARDRWTSYRNMCRQKVEQAGTASSSSPKEPLKPAKPPVAFLRPAQDILTCESTVAIVQLILWKVLASAHPAASSALSDSENSVSDAVISTCLHLLVHGVHIAAASSDESFWKRLSKINVGIGRQSVLHLLSKLLDQATLLLDGEQTGTVEWLIWKINVSSPLCSQLFKKLASDTAKEKIKKEKAKASPTTAAGSNAQSGASPPKTLEQRKSEARKRAMEAVAKRQAAFQAMVDLADDESEEKESADHARTDTQMEGVELEERPTPLGKRHNVVAEEPSEETKKRQRVESEPCYSCILCHDTSAQGQMGMAAYAHQSTVLAPGFRPEPQEALGMEGKQVRSQVKDVIEKMELCSGGSSMTDMMDSPSPPMHAFSAPFPEWVMDPNMDEQPRDGGVEQTTPRAPAPPRRNRNDRIHFGGGQIPMLEGEFLQRDELEVLEGVLDFPEDQRIFHHEVQGGVNQELRGDHVMPRRLGGRDAAAPAGGMRGANGRGHLDNRNMPMYDSDDDDGFDDAGSPRFHMEQMPPGFGRACRESAKLYLTPCGLHIRTCQHAVHIHCLERYITSLHDKAMRGEEFDGVQAIDPDSAMTQFLCPLCKTLSNFLIPISEPRVSTKSKDDDEQKQSTNANMLVSLSGDREQKRPPWSSVIDEQLAMPGWFRSVLGRDGVVEDDGNDTEHDLWREYFEETLWEPHGSLEKGAPFLWSSAAFTLASFLSVAEDEFRLSSGSTTPFDPLTDQCPMSQEKELESLTAVTKFCRWTFSLLEHSEDAKVIWETAKRCCPINTETKREYRKFTKVLGSIDACLRGTILGLLVADMFTAFVVSSVIADDLETIWRFIPVFSAADVLQRLHAEFFEASKTEETSLFQDKYSTVEKKAEAPSTAASEGASALKVAPRRTRSGLSLEPSRSSANIRTASGGSAKDLLEAMEVSGDDDSEVYAAVQLLERMAKDSSEKMKPLTSMKDVSARLQRLLLPNAEFVRRMKLFWRCLVDKECKAPAWDPRMMHIPTLTEVANCSDAVFDQIWRWCLGRMVNKNFLGTSKTGDKCEHTEGCSEAYVASMFILREVPTQPQLIKLPSQYDKLYSEMTDRKCTRCNKSPCEPGLCLICGEFLCCGDSCCTRAFMPHGPPVGECTRHAAECGGGVGIVLLLEQCRIALVGGSMAAYFPSPYVDAHGEEDIGLQRGRPLRLDMARYSYLESLWRSHRIFTEVSRQRNQRDPQYTINLSYL